MDGQEIMLPEKQFNLLLRLFISLVAGGISLGVGYALVSLGAGLLAAIAAVLVVNLTILTPKLLKDIHQAWDQNGHA
jgi:biopolymer transport protein ExbB/TolQ